MTDICQAIYTYLSENEQIKECVGNKIFPIMLPEEAPIPAIVYSPVLANYDSALQGDTGFVRQTIQFICHDRTFKRARELSRLVKRTFQDFHGNMCGLEIQAAFIKTDYEYNGNTALKFNTEEYLSSIEFEFYYNEKQEDENGGSR